MEFGYDGGGLAKGGDVTLYYDGKDVGTGRVEITQPMVSRLTKRPTSATNLAPPSVLITRRTPAGSPERSTGCKLILARTISTTSSIQRSASA